MWYQSNPIHTEKSHRFHRFTQIFLKSKNKSVQIGEICGTMYFILREGGYDFFLEVFLDFFAFA